MDMSMATTTAASEARSSMTASGTSPSSTSSMSMGMSMGMGSGNQCKISMLWNWNTVDSCFIAESWQITSKGMFAGSCIGVIYLVISLEFLRRLGKEYDRFIRGNHQLRSQQLASDTSVQTPCLKSASQTFTPTIMQQSIRALLHMVQFAVAYFVMLLAMYYNGYFIICIFIGAYIGSFIFSWESITFEGNKEASVANEATICCG